MEKNTNYTIELLRNELDKISEDTRNIASENLQEVTILSKLADDFDKGLITKQKFNKMLETCKKNNKERSARLDELEKSNNAIKDIILKELQTA